MRINFIVFYLLFILIHFHQCSDNLVLFENHISDLIVSSISVNLGHIY